MEQILKSNLGRDYTGYLSRLSIASSPDLRL